MKKVLFPILALVLALGLSLPMAAPVAANPDVIWEIGDINQSRDDLKTSDWTGVETFTYIVGTHTASDFPSVLYTAGYGGDPRGVHEVTISFSLSQWYGNLQLVYGRAGAETDEVKVDSGPAQTVPGGTEGVWTSHTIGLGLLPQGPHSIVISCVSGGDGLHAVDAVKLTGDPLSFTPIKTDTFDWTAPNNGTTGHVEIIEMMLNEENTTAFYDAMNVTVTGQEAFIYQVTNVDWTPINGLNGFSGFNIPNHFDIDTVDNAFGPPGWEAFAGYSGINTPPQPDHFEWDIRDDVGNGLLVGQTGLFGYTVAAGKYIDVLYPPISHMHSWSGGTQADIFAEKIISGPAPFITKEMTAGPTVVPLYTDVEWELVITVTNNDAVNNMTGVVVKDNFGGDLEVVSVGGVTVNSSAALPLKGKQKEDTYSTSVGNVTILWTGKTEKAHLFWDVGTLTPGQSATLTLLVSTDMNTGHGNGKNLKFPDGHQEYTSPGTHCLNSGATATGMLDGWEMTASSDEICVEVTEAVLILENKDSGWQPIVDGTWGEFGYNLAGPTFDYAFNVYGLEPDTAYSLIYYADFVDRYNVWGGDNPGALIATMTTDGSGNVCISGSIDLGMDLPSPPDANINVHSYNVPPDNYAHEHGAKIWLVPSSAYDAGNTKVTAWQPTRFLFETDLIWYDDTDV